jgi:DNA polymerase III epsilon subunit-like protein
LDQVWDKFEKYIFDPQYIVVGQNLLGFDVYMLAILQRLLGQEPDYSYLPRIYDTRALGKAYREELDRPKGNLLSWQYKIINDRSLKAKVSQNQLLKFFDIEFDESKLHNALYDIQMCYKIFLKLKKHMDL